MGTSNRISGASAERKLAAVDGDCTSVEPFGESALIARKRSIARKVWTLGLRAVVAEVVGALRHSKRKAGLDGHDAGDMPARSNYSDETRPMECMALPNRKLIGPAGSKSIRDIAVRNILFAQSIVTIGNRKIGEWASENGSVKDG